MSIAEQIRNNQNAQEMTRRAIQILEACGEDISDLKEEFLALYGETV